MQSLTQPPRRSSPELQLLDLLGAELGRLRLAPAGRRHEDAADGPPMLAVLVLHLDGLSAWRAHRGDAAARALLHLVAARLSAQLRVGDRTYGPSDDASDGPVDPRRTTDASGGCCLLSDVRSVSAAHAIAERLRQHLGKPWHIGPARLNLRASIGIAVGPAADLVRLLDEATRALRGACTQPGGLLPFRDPGADSDASAAGR